MLGGIKGAVIIFLIIVVFVVVILIIIMIITITRMLPSVYISHCYISVKTKLLKQSQV